MGFIESGSHKVPSLVLYGTKLVSRMIHFGFNVELVSYKTFLEPFLAKEGS